MPDIDHVLTGYRARGWRVVPVHRPDPDSRCSCGKAECPKPGKHPVTAFWPQGSDNPADFAGRNVGVKLGPESGDLADVDLDCREAVVAGGDLLPATGCAFGRGGFVTHRLYLVPTRDAAYAKLTDPVLTGDQATIVELRWPEWDEAEKRFKNLQTVIPPSLHHSGETLAWAGPGDIAVVDGGTLGEAVRHVGAAVLIARYAKPKERHGLLLLLCNLLVRSGWADDARVRAFATAVFAVKNDADMVARIAGAEGASAVKDARKRLKNDKPMTGLPALEEMLDSALEPSTAEKVVGCVKDWLGVPDPPGPTINSGGRNSNSPPSPPRYTPLPPWVPFPTQNLPDAIRAFADTVSAAMRCDPTYVALPALAVCAGMIGATRTIRLKRSWDEPDMVWAVVVGESGTLKTPPYKRAIAPVIALQKAHLAAHMVEMEEYRAKLREYERAKKKAGEDDPGDPPAEPVCPRIYSRDTTIEALGGLLQNNTTRFLIGRDEVSGWLSSFNQYKAKGGSDLANWLELHSLGTLCVDRKTGEPKVIFVPNVGVSLCGGIQPGVLRSALSPQHFSAGIPARLLFAYPSRWPKKWTEDDIDPAAEAAYHRLVNALAKLEPQLGGDGEPSPLALPMTPEAKAEWVVFYGRFADKQAETDGDLAAAFSKLEGYAARLALVHHVCQSVSAGGDARGEIGLASVRAGVALAEWFTAETERVYQMPGEEETRKLFDLVSRVAERNGGAVTVKQLQRANCRKYKTRAVAEAALESLAALGLGRWQDGPPRPGGGRRVRSFVPCMPHDVSDPCDPDEDDDGPGGGGPARDAHPDAPPGPPAGRDATPVESATSEPAGDRDAPQGSETSCGMHGSRGRDRQPDGGDEPAGETPIVMQSAESVRPDETGCGTPPPPPRAEV